jgi:hypothetical protein
MGLSPDQFLNLDDPVEALGSHVQELVFTDEAMIAACHMLVCREMGLHIKSMVGGDATDRRDWMMQWIDENTDDTWSMADLCKSDMPDYIIETDPRYDLYWEKMSNLHSQILAQTIAGNKFRWTKQFVQTLNDRRKK